MYVTKTVVVRNLSPLVVSSTSGNYVRTVDYIPGTTILGAYLSAKVPPDKLFSERVEITPKISVTDAFPGEGELNPASLVTITTSSGGKYRDAAREVIEGLVEPKALGLRNPRLRKGPRHWRINRGIEPLNVRVLETTIVQIDENLRVSFTQRVDQEVTGNLAHVFYVSPCTTFNFEAHGEEEEVKELEERLKEGIRVGALRTKGYGLIELVKSRESTGSGGRGPLNVNGWDFSVISVYGNLDYSYYSRVEGSLRDSIVWKSVSLTERRSWSYGKWRVKTYVRSGSVLVVKTEKDKYPSLKNLEVESLKLGGGGKLIVDHRVHG